MAKQIQPREKNSRVGKRRSPSQKQQNGPEQSNLRTPQVSALRTKCQINQVGSAANLF